MTLESYVTAHSYDPRTRMTLDLVTGMRLHAPQPTCPCLCGKHTLNNLVSGMRLEAAEARWRCGAPRLALTPPPTTYFLERLEAWSSLLHAWLASLPG
jgi:hypothetical protein